MKIEANGLQEAIELLAKALTGMNVTQKPAVEVVESEKVEPEKVEEKTEDPVEDPVEQQEEPKVEDKKEDKAPKISLETVRVKLAELNSAGKGAAVKALIAEYDSSDRPKLSNVSKDDYAELLEKAAEL